MSVVSINNRKSNNLDEFNRYRKSDLSLLYTDASQVKEFSIELTLGNQWAEDVSREKPAMYMIDGETFSLKGKTSAVVEVQEILNVPLNLYGIIFPKGSSFLEKGVIVSAGKIEPGFSGKLQILLFNTTNKKRTFRKGTIIASAIFIRTDKTINSPAINSEQIAVHKEINVMKKVLRFFKSDPKYTVNLLITILTSSLIAALITFNISKPVEEDRDTQNNVEEVNK